MNTQVTKAVNIVSTTEAQRRLEPRSVREKKKSNEIEARIIYHAEPILCHT